jgi:GNAT superfamily N-acetyltransferase
MQNSWHVYVRLLLIRHTNIILVLSMIISIRPLTIEDEPALWEFIYLALYVPSGQPPFPRNIVYRPEISRYVQGWGKPNDFGLIAHNGNSHVGAAWLRLLTGSNKGYGYVDDDTPELSMAVVAEYRRQGVGSQLLTGLIDKTHSRFQAICLSVDDNNSARRLYDRFGFTVVSKTGSSLTMVKQLVPL